MSEFTEGNLRIQFPTDVQVRKFDTARQHGRLNCMKAVDFIAELDDRYLFIEFKDPQHPKAQQTDRDEFIEKLGQGAIDEDLKYKYRDSLLYEWACQRAEKPIFFYVLIALDTLTDADLLVRTDALKRKLPLPGPPSGTWIRNIVAGCAVFNLTTWNEYLPEIPVSRIA